MDARQIFRADTANAIFWKNSPLYQRRSPVAGLAHVKAKRGGLFTIDLVTSTRE